MKQRNSHVEDTKPLRSDYLTRHTVDIQPRQRYWIKELLLLLVVLLLGYFLFPWQTRFLLIGVDRAPEGTLAGRTDTIIITGVNPLLPSVRMLSIPRDLWVAIPGVGENRINTAHFFAEAEKAGTGPEALRNTIYQNFGLDVPYYMRLSFDGFVKLVDAMGGVKLVLDEPAAGYPAGEHVLTGEQALAFVRSRAGSDDFYRMAHGQLLIQAMMRQFLEQDTYRHWREITQAFQVAVDTNIPLWLLPRLGLGLLRGYLQGTIVTYVIDRNYVDPYTTEGGANVLLPHTDEIIALMNQLFR